MHGAGNDFILVDDREQTFPADDPAGCERVASRRTGVGCEGIILIQPSESADFRMRFFNPDGSEVEMCGNGARCVARLAYDLGVASSAMAFDTVAGVIRAEVLEDQIRLEMTDPHGWQFDAPIVFGEKKYTRHFVDSGVPHVVVPVENLATLDVQAFGAAIRYHPDYAPQGTNANFIEVTGPAALSIRTYERGVEAETLACGTGIVAAALIAGKLGLVTPTVTVTPASGDPIEVNYEVTVDGAEHVTMRGPAVHVFSGTLEYAR